MGDLKLDFIPPCICSVNAPGSTSSSLCPLSRIGKFNWAGRGSPGPAPVAGQRPSLTMVASAETSPRSTHQAGFRVSHSGFPTIDFDKGPSRVSIIPVSPRIDKRSRRGSSPEEATMRSRTEHDNHVFGEANPDNHCVHHAARPDVNREGDVAKPKNACTHYGRRAADDRDFDETNPNNACMQSVGGGLDHVFDETNPNNACTHAQYEGLTTRNELRRASALREVPPTGYLVDMGIEDRGTLGVDGGWRCESDGLIVQATTLGERSPSCAPS